MNMRITARHDKGNKHLQRACSDWGVGLRQAQTASGASCGALGGKDAHGPPQKDLRRQGKDYL